MSLRQRLLSALLTAQVSENVVPQSVPASGLSLELTTLRILWELHISLGLPFPVNRRSLADWLIALVAWTHVATDLRSLL